MCLVKTAISRVDVFSLRFLPALGFGNEGSVRTFRAFGGLGFRSVRNACLDHALRGLPVRWWLDGRRNSYVYPVQYIL